ncbi:MAG: flavin reductase family protein [Oscillospiraceae bacterium]
MKKQHWQGSVLLAPVPPALISCGTMEKPNALTVAWTGILNTQPPKTYISLRPERYSYNLIKDSGEFVINLPTEKMVRAVDYCGCRSGAKEDKLKKCALTAMESVKISAPQIAQSPVSLECKVTQIIELGTHHMFLADIVGVNVDETLIDEKGKLHLSKAGLCAYAHGEYFALGKKVGDFGFSVRKKSTEKRRQSKKRENNNDNKR